MRVDRLIRAAAAALACSLVAGGAPGSAQSAAQPVPPPIDTVWVELTDAGAIVEQRISNTDDLVEAFAIRITGQTIEVTDVAREGEVLLDATLTVEDGALRFAVVSGAPVTVRYEVTGSAERIPLFVPGGRAVVTVVRGVEQPFLIRLSGPEARISAIDTDTSMPRFARADGGALEVRLSSLPAFLRLSPGGALSFARLADALAVALIVLGATLAFRRLRAASRTSSAAS